MRAIAGPLGRSKGAPSMKTVVRLLGLARKLLTVLILLGKFVLIVMQIMSGATNYRAAHLFT
jgi:hypothetical protein